MLKVSLGRTLATAFIALSCGGAALADPVGTFDVVGVNPETGQQYSGSVRVTRTGETYGVIWNIGGAEFIGSGLGARFVGSNKFRVGAASKDDVAISVGYQSSDNSVGIAMYFEQPDKSWKGVWTYKGSDRAISETWTRR
jgi:hypothetical protein